MTKFRSVRFGLVGVGLQLLGACTQPTTEDGDGGGSGSTGAGGGAAGAARGGEQGGVGRASCQGAEPLAQDIGEDTTIGPGCVRINETSVNSTATLTIAPGTRVEFLAGGYLSVARNGDTAVLRALGTAAEPIVFTSAEANPAPGDWQCIRLGGDGSELDHVDIEYGGAPCNATGGGPEALVLVAGEPRGISHTTFRHSSSTGLFLDTGAPRTLEGNTFGSNAGPSLRVSAPELTKLGNSSTFEDADDFVLVGDEGISEPGTWANQGVPYRVPRGFGSSADLSIEAGTRIEIGGGSFDVGRLDILGTAQKPVTFTSSQPNPRAGDWGCIHFNQVSRIEHAIFEYAGSGEGCTGGSSKTAVLVTDGTSILDSTFRSIAGAAIENGNCADADAQAAASAWCANQFESVSDGPLRCGTTLRACP